MPSKTMKGAASALPAAEPPVGEFVVPVATDALVMVALDVPVAVFVLVPLTLRDTVEKTRQISCEVGNWPARSL